MYTFEYHFLFFVAYCCKRPRASSTELRDALQIKEKEKEIYVSHLNLNSADPNYGAKIVCAAGVLKTGVQTGVRSSVRRTWCGQVCANI